ncbi:MAG: glycosyltransferase family 1 protein [Candidatus Moraniibacteriota bacterium]
MRIGIDLRNVGKQRTGDEAVFFHLTRGLARLNPTEHEFRLFVDNRTEEELQILRARLEIVGKENWSFVNLETSGRFHWNAIALPRALRAEHLDVYHTQYITPFFVPKEIAIVTHIHDVSFALYPEHIQWKDRLFLSLLIPRSLRAARKIIAVSEFTKREIVECYGIAEEKIAVVYNAVGDDFLSLNTNTEDLERVRTKYHLPAQFAVCVGTLQPRKNIPAFLRAFARLRERLPNAKVVLVGSRTAHNVDTEIDQVITEEHLEQTVIFPGFIEQVDLPSVIGLSEMLVFPSLYEGFGIPVLEAMSQGVSVVSADIPSLNEVAGGASIRVNTADTEAFTHILQRVFTDEPLRDTLREKGFSQIQEFSWEKNARQLLAVYESCLLIQ